MGGDQGNGLSLVILICTVLMVVGGAILLAVAGRLLTRRHAPPRRTLVTLSLALVGAGLGFLVALSTFHQSTLWPPPRLSLTTPAGFDAPVAILLDDPRGGRTLAWSGGTLPFTAPAAELAVPPSGIVRLRGFGPIAGRGHVEVTWPDGRPGRAAGGGNSGPPGTGANGYLIIEPPEPPPADAALAADDGPAIAAYIAQREGRR